VCRCYDNRRHGHGVVGGADAAVADNGNHGNPPASAAAAAGALAPTELAILGVAEEEDDDDADKVARCSRLRFEIAFHRPCGSQSQRRRRITHEQRRFCSEPDGATNTRPPTATGRRGNNGDTIELNLFVSSATD